MDGVQIDPLLAEMTLARLGLQPLLGGKPRRLGRRAPDIGREMQRLIDGFLASSKRAPLSPDPPFDFDEVSKLIDGSSADRASEALRAAVPDQDMFDAIEQAATKMVETLHSELPQTTREDIYGTVIEPGSDLDVARFARAWSVANDPLIALRDLAEGSLTTDMVQALAMFWPSLYQMAQAYVREALADMRAKRPGPPPWELEPRRDRLLRLFMGVPYVDPEIAADYQALFAQGAAQQKPQQPTEAGETAPGADVKQLDTKDALATPGQAQ
jgi:hypothetical protein